MTIIQDVNDLTDSEIIDYLKRDKSNIVFFLYVDRHYYSKLNKQSNRKNLINHKTNIRELYKNCKADGYETLCQLEGTLIYIDTHLINYIIVQTMDKQRVFFLEYEIVKTDRYIVNHVSICDHASQVNESGFIYPLFNSFHFFTRLADSSFKKRPEVIEQARVVVDYLTDLTKDGVIPVGTKLYHATVHEKFRFDMKDPSYFGLDVVISLWMIPEKTMDYHGEAFMAYGHLYEFAVVEPIPIKMIEPDLDKELDDTCVEYKEDKQPPVCLHPSLAYHISIPQGRTISDYDTHDVPIGLQQSSGEKVYARRIPLADMCAEAYMPMNYYSSYIKLVSHYIVDTRVLLLNADKKLSEFNPVSAIVCEIDQ